MAKITVPDNTKFEDAMAKLESLSEMLANESIPLDDSIKIYEEGLAYYEYCKSVLDNANQRIITIEKNMEKA